MGAGTWRGAAPLPADARETTLVEHLGRQLRDRPTSAAMCFLVGRRWAPVSWAQLGAAARRLAAVLADRGVAAGDHVAIWSGGRAEWHIADAAVLSAGCVSVAMDVPLTEEGALAILRETGARAVVVETPELLDRILAVRDSLPALDVIIVIEGAVTAAHGDAVLSWTDALNGGQALAAQHGMELDRRAAAVRPEDPAIVVSAAAGAARSTATRWTHGELARAAAAAVAAVPSGPDDRLVARRGPAELDARIETELRSFMAGTTVYLLAGIPLPVARLADSHPTLMVAAPGDVETLAAPLRAALDRPVRPRARLLRWAVAAGLAASATRGTPTEARPRSLRPRFLIADRLVLRRRRAALGLAHATVLTGTATPPDPTAAGLLVALGVRLREAAPAARPSARGAATEK